MSDTTDHDRPQRSRKLQNWQELEGWTQIGTMLGREEWETTWKVYGPYLCDPDAVFQKQLLEKETAFRKL